LSSQSELHDGSERYKPALYQGWQPMVPLPWTSIGGWLAQWVSCRMGQRELDLALAFVLAVKWKSHVRK